MDEPKPNPLTAHLLNMVQGRQQTEVAKLALLTQIAAGVERIAEHADKTEALLTELLERERER